jgi:hypothetical protein
VTENEPVPFDSNFRVWFDALSARVCCHSDIVIVSDDKVLPAMQSSKQLRDALCGLADSEISEMPNLIPIRADNRVPTINHPLIHLGD